MGWEYMYQLHSFFLELFVAICSLTQVWLLESFTDNDIVLRKTITGPGVWRIRRKHKASRIEILHLEAEGHGNIISEEFFEWRESFN